MRTRSILSCGSIEERRTVIDTHCHILPGLDDGAKDLAAALNMARTAVSDGVTAIHATPHMREGDYLNERPEVLAACDLLRQALLVNAIKLEVLPGSEVHLAPKLVDRAREGKILTYNDRGAHMLLECPYRNRPMRLSETVFELKVAGMTPVIAHPERIRFFQDEPEAYEQVIHQGALGQMTTSSLLGLFGSKVQKLSEDWVRRGLVHVLGSDAHDLEYRPPRLALARERWAALTDDAQAERATVAIPQAFIDGAVVDVDSPAPPSRSRSWVSRLLGG